MDTYDLIDNLSVYRHLQFPREIIKNPKVIIKVKNKLTNVIYFFGCATMPLKKELEEFFLPIALWEEERYNSLEFEMKNYQYQVLTINE